MATINEDDAIVNSCDVFPSFLEIKEFIEENPRSTICEIRDKFNQSGEDIISQLKPNCKQKQLILAFNINSDFFAYLQQFIKEDYVLCDVDPMACLISDSQIYKGPGEFLPIILSIKK